MEGELQPEANTPAGAVFLSYASQDAQAARRICAALRTAGVEVWFDQSELRGGDAWDQSIRKQIKTCSLFIPVISQNTHARAEGYFRLEWKLAVDRSHLISADKAFLLPVVIDDTPDDDVRVPERFREVQWTRLPAGETPPPFAQRVQLLLSGEASVPTHTAAPSGAAGAASGRSRTSAWSRRTLPVAAVVVLGVMAFLSIDRPWTSKPPASPTHASPVTPLFAPPPHSVAVLPFVNMSGDKEQEYFSEGLTEELLSSLAEINELQVAARTSSFSFKDQEVDVATIAHKLNVASVLEGSVRRSGSTIRVSAQLIDAVTGFHVWSRSYDRDVGDVLKMQSEIASAVAGALKVTMLGDVSARLELGGTHNAAAFDAYARGLYAHFNQREDTDEKTAVTAFSEAIQRDPRFALAFAARSIALTSADTPTPEALEKARADAYRAIDLAPELPEGHLALGLLFEQLLEFSSANEQYERALALAPGKQRILRKYGFFAVLMGRTDSGLVGAHRAVTLDPVNFDAYGLLGGALFFAHRYDEALAAYKKARAVFPDSYIPIDAFEGQAYYAKGDYLSARAACEGKREHDVHRVCLAMTYDKLGQRAAAEAELAKMKRFSAHAYYYAEIYAQWGNRTKALEWLEASMQQRNPELEWLKADPFMDPLRSEPRFQAVVRELKFPD